MRLRKAKVQYRIELSAWSIDGRDRNDATFAFASRSKVRAVIHSHRKIMEGRRGEFEEGQTDVILLFKGCGVCVCVGGGG